MCRLKWIFFYGCVCWDFKIQDVSVENEDFSGCVGWIKFPVLCFQDVTVENEDFSDVSVEIRLSAITIIFFRMCRLNILFFRMCRLKVYVRLYFAGYTGWTLKFLRVWRLNLQDCIFLWNDILCYSVYKYCLDWNK